MASAGTYAKKTKVKQTDSRREIETLLTKHDADQVIIGIDNRRRYGTVAFLLGNRRYQISLPLPAPDDDEFRYTGAGSLRESAVAKGFYEQEVNRRWRALLLFIKASLEADETGIMSLETILQPYIMLPSGQTMGEAIKPHIDRMYQGGDFPPLLPPPSK